MAETMQSWQILHPGTIPSNIQLSKDTPKPSQDVKDTQLLVEVIAAGINPADYKVAELGMVARAIISFPKTPGMDLSGRVVSVGSKVTDLKAGDLIVGRVDPLKKEGALSQYIVMERDSVAPLAAGADPVHAAGLPTAGLTAYQTIAPYVQAGRGDKVFINGGSGGVGTYGIQIAKLLGCHVTVTCSTLKIEFCKGLGADEIIDYKKTDVIAALKAKGEVFSVVADNVGNAPADLFSSSHFYLKQGSPYVFVGGQISFGAVKNNALTLLTPGFLGGRKRQFVTYLTKGTKEDIETITGWFNEGKLKTIIDSTYPFEDAQKAFEKVKSGSCAGKVIVKVAA